MRVAKATKKDIETTGLFLQMAELLLERQKFSLKSAYEQWRDWDEDDEDYKLAIQIQKRIAREEDIDIDKVDDRLIAYELLHHSFAKASCSHGRVIMAADVLIDNIVPASSTILEFHPGFQFNHVDKEQ